MAKDRKRRIVTGVQRYLVNPPMRLVCGHLPGQAVLETTGRRSGLPRRTPVGGLLDAGSFWLVSEHGPASQYIRNIEADPRVRLQVGSAWRTGIAHLLPEDDVYARLRLLPTMNSLAVRLVGTDLLTVRVDLS